MTVILIGGVFFMATTIAGLLMFYQLQESTNFRESTKAIYAADAGLERATYYYYHKLPLDTKCPPSDPCSDVPQPSLSNSTVVSAEIVFTEEVVKITAKGESGRTVRLLQTTFE